jgi:hypothetical protein
VVDDDDEVVVDVAILGWMVVNPEVVGDATKKKKRDNRDGMILL